MPDLTFVLPPARVQLRWVERGDDVTGTGLLTRIDEDKRLLIRLDRSEKNPVEPPTKGTSLVVRIGADTGLYIAPGLVEGANLAGTTIFVELTGEPERIQRRKFVRASVDLPMSTGQLLDADGNPVERFALRVINLSGGGLYFECLEPLPDSADILVSLNLDGGNQISARIRIVGSDEGGVIQSDDGLNTKFFVRGYFARILDREQQKIVQYIFRKQASMRHLR